MRQFSLYIIILLIALGGSGCGGKTMNKRLTLWRNDKIPYGLNYTRSVIPYLFPDARIINSDDSPIELNAALDDTLNKRAGLFILTPKMRPDEQEINSIMDFIAKGNHVFISTLEIGSNFQDSLRIETKYSNSKYSSGDSMSFSLEHLGDTSRDYFTYPGRKVDNYFEDYDTAITWIRGYNSNGEPNLIEFDYKGGGSLVLQVAPIAYTNFFLLHKSNAKYLDETMSYLPDSLQTIYWNDYYRYHTDGKKNDDNSPNTFSKLRVFMNDPILRWVVILLFILFAFVYVFESRRRQRVRAVEPATGNPSVDFVKTVGSLYFQAKDNKDLAIKMSNHFTEYVRGRYMLNVSIQDESFADRLSHKSGFSKDKLNDILHTIRNFNEADSVDDQALLQFDHKLQDFYKQG